MSTPKLDVATVQTLTSVSYKGLRVSVSGEGVSARDLLRGNVRAESLDCIVRKKGHVTDLVGTFWAGVFLVSERFRASIAELDATGWRITQVQVEAVESPLWLLSITGTCGPLFGVGGMRLAGAPTLGTFVDPDRWDGSDFFLADNNNSIHVLGSTAERIRRLGLSNLAFESAGLEPLRSD